MPTSTLAPMAPNGQVIIPQSLREALGLPDGGELELIGAEGVVLLRPADRLTPEELAAVRRSQADYAAGRYRTDVTVEELERRIAEG